MVTGGRPDAAQMTTKPTTKVFVAATLSHLHDVIRRGLFSHVVTTSLHPNA